MLQSGTPQFGGLVGGGHPFGGHCAAAKARQLIATIMSVKNFKKFQNLKIFFPLAKSLSFQDLLTYISW
jgi:hypothetical protein